MAVHAMRSLNSVISIYFKVVFYNNMSVYIPLCIFVTFIDGFALCKFAFSCPNSRYMDPSFDKMLMDCRTSVNLLYIQVSSTMMPRGLAGQAVKWAPKDPGTQLRGSVLVVAYVE